MIVNMSRRFAAFDITPVGKFASQVPDFIHTTLDNMKNVSFPAAKRELLYNCKEIDDRSE